MRRILLLVGATLSALVFLSGPASAGGGCHAGATQGSGEVVEMVDACFTPTTLRIEPGDSVTFVNSDPMIHNVVANGWGHFDDLDQGDRFRVSFDDAGVYPYACTYHPGMTGAIVVGDGTGAGNGPVVTVAIPDDAPPVVATTAPEPARAGMGVGWVALAGVAGLVIGVVIGKARGKTERSVTREA